MTLRPSDHRPSVDEEARDGFAVADSGDDRVRVRHAATGAVIAEGPRGWGMTAFEGNLYIRAKYLREGRFRTTWIPGLCPYKGLYVWLDYEAPDGSRERMVAWRYWLPNPLLPFVAFRVGLPQTHPRLIIEDG
jgi:uncharacterized protein (DUF427 family)